MLSRWIKEVREGKIVSNGEKVELDTETVAELKRLTKFEKDHERLKLEHAPIRKCQPVLFRTRTEVYRFTAQNRETRPIKRGRDLYGISRSGYSAWRSRGPSRRQQENAGLIDAIKDTHASTMGTYGSPRITRALQQQGYEVGENRVARPMQANQIMARSAKLYHINPANHAFFTEIPNRIHQLEATGPDQIWAGDITYSKVAANGVSWPWSWTCSVVVSRAGRRAGTARLI